MLETVERNKIKKAISQVKKIKSEEEEGNLPIVDI